MKLNIINCSARRVLSRSFLRQWIRTVFRELRKKNIGVLNPQLNVVFVNSLEMQKLNRYFRSQNKPTDVLSFPVSDRFSPQQTELGEIVLCTGYIKQMKQGSVRERTAYAILHGILHLMGFEHEKSPRLAKRMYQIQDEIFEKYF